MKFEVKLKRNTHLHSKEHVLADDLSRAMGEPARFASYLGIARLYREDDLRSLARRVIEKEDLLFENRGKYFFAALKGLPKKPGVIFRRAKKKTANDSTKLTTRKPKRKSKKRASSTRLAIHGKTSRTARTK